MADVYKHFNILLACLMLVDAGGHVDAKGHFGRKYFSGHERIPHRELRIRRSKDNRSNRETVVKHVVPVIGQTRSTVILHCKVDKITIPAIENVTVVWMKWEDDASYTILTMNLKVVTFDKRFFASNKANSKDWYLHIRYTQISDAGLYQCQTCSNSNPTNSFTQLKLKDARATIIGGPTKEVEKPGSPLRLSCVLENSIEAPAYIFWYHGDRMINYDLNDGATVRDDRRGSELIFPIAERKHSGNYSCVPSNAQQASVEVIFLSTETLDPNDGTKNSGKKSHPQGHIVNMPVLISAFYFFGEHYRLQT